jgi:enoyl-CoA hydratase
MSPCYSNDIKEIGMKFECILYEKDEDIATIKLNRPKVLNAMNKQLWLDFQIALEDVRNDPSINVLIVTSRNQRTGV